MLLRLLLEQVDFLNEPRVRLTILLVLVQILPLNAQIHFEVIQHVLYIRISFGMLPLLSRCVGHVSLSSTKTRNADVYACNPGCTRRYGGAILRLIVHFVTPRYDSPEVIPVNRLGLG